MTTPDDALEDAAFALLLAAVTIRDLLGAMPRPLLASMPRDISNRLEHGYQDAFDALPLPVRTAAQRRLDVDPDIIAARWLDEGTRRG